jgi:hypothetical protein
MTYWVHREADGEAWNRSTRHEPPLPTSVAGRGFPHFHVEYRGFVFDFASLDEIRSGIDVLGRKVLPSTLRLTADRGGQVGPNTHWLSRLPPHVLSWRYREPAVEYMRDALRHFEKELGQGSDR